MKDETKMKCWKWLCSIIIKYNMCCKIRYNLQRINFENLNGIYIYMYTTRYLKTVSSVAKWFAVW